MTTITRLFPAPTTCHQCGAVDAVAVCPKCGTDRPVVAALKNITAKLRAMPALQLCAYFPNEACGCGRRGECLQPA